MVRALLAGTKTQTRRIVRFADWQGSPGAYLGQNDGGDHVFTPTERWGGQLRCPYGVPGDTLWVRETLKRAPDLWSYAADGEAVGWPARGDLAGKSRDTIVSIHMPRNASRITLRVTDVRIERLGEITEADAEAEGAPCGGFDDDGQFHEHQLGNFRCGYAGVWEHINGPGSWDANPWLWAVSFEVISGAALADTSGRLVEGPGNTSSPSTHGENK